ncbi:MAG: FapA family protein, partial [Treponema sp.]|nr:FapA family protein [Treponema sp.]
DVKGAKISQDGIVPVNIIHDDSIRETPEGGGLRLVAARSGELVYDGKELRISGVRIIKGDAGKAAGNINFPGDIKISGKAEPGVSVTGRNVFIAGLSEAALVSAGGRVVIAGGIKGAGKGIVRARGAIEAAFVEAAILLAVEDITVNLGCTGCNIKTNGKLTVSGKTGKLAGGVCRARRGIDVEELGGRNGLRTEISFGQDYLLKDKIDATESEIEKARAVLKKIDMRIKGAVNNPAALGAAGSEKVKLLKALERLKLQIFTLREKFEEHCDSEVKVRGAVHPGVIIESHGRYYEINRPREAAVFYFDRETGRIKER